MANFYDILNLSGFDIRYKVNRVYDATDAHKSQTSNQRMLRLSHMDQRHNQQTIGCDQHFLSLEHGNLMKDAERPEVLVLMIMRA